MIVTTQYIKSDCTETRDDDDNNNHQNDNNITTLSLPCNLISVSQNFCSSVKYLSSMNTLEWPTLAITPESGTVVYIGRGACFSKELPSSFVAKSSRFLPQVTRPNQVRINFVLQLDEKSSTSSQKYSRAITQTITQKKKIRTGTADGHDRTTRRTDTDCSGSKRARGGGGPTTTGGFFNYRAPAAALTIDTWRV